MEIVASPISVFFNTFPPLGFPPLVINYIFMSLEQSEEILLQYVLGQVV